MAVSFFLAFVALNIDGYFLKTIVWPYYVFSMILLILVLLIGREINGAKSWITLGGFTLQPSEFAKLGIALALAKYMSRPETKITQLKSRITAFALIAVPILFILLQPDAGSALVGLAFIFTFYREGMSGNIIVIGLVGLVIGLISVVTSYSSFNYWIIGEQSSLYLFQLVLVIIGLLALLITSQTVIPRNRKRVYTLTLVFTVFAMVFSFLCNHVITSDKYLKTHHKARIELLLGVADEQLQRERGYNMLMAKTAIGSGSVFGKGYLQGPMTEFEFVPEQNTDFIFTAIAEEFGFLGSAFVVFLYMYLILRLIYLAERQRSSFSRIFGYCIAGIFFMHFVINIGMVLGLAPVIGIPLPFISKGGSSLMVFTVMIFLFLRLDSLRFSIVERT